jgi:hypothetical protein
MCRLTQWMYRAASRGAISVSMMSSIGLVPNHQSIGACQLSLLAQPSVRRGVNAVVLKLGWWRAALALRCGTVPARRHIERRQTCCGP